MGVGNVTHPLAAGIVREMKAILAQQKKVQAREARRFREREALVTALETQDNRLQSRYGLIRTCCWGRAADPSCSFPIVQREITDLSASIRRKRAELVWLLEETERVHDVGIYQKEVELAASLKENYVEQIKIETENDRAEEIQQQIDEQVNGPPVDIVRLEERVQELKDELQSKTEIADAQEVAPRLLRITPHPCIDMLPIPLQAILLEKVDRVKAVDAEIGELLPQVHSKCDQVLADCLRIPTIPIPESKLVQV